MQIATDCSIGATCVPRATPVASRRVLAARRMVSRRVLALAARRMVSPRVLALAVVGTLLGVPAALGLYARLGAERPATSASVYARSASRAMSLALPPAALGPVSAALGGADPAYRIHRAGPGFAGTSPAQHLELHFARAGVRLSSRGVGIGLSLRAAGYGNALAAAGDPTLRVRGNRALYTRPAVREWYVNGPLGLEQGFTLARALPGHAPGPLTLAMTLSGSAHASLESNGRGIALAGAGGGSLRYGDLLATDARGKPLHAWFALAGRTVLLRVDTRGARYPLRIDPLIESSQLDAGPESEGTPFGHSVALSADGETALIGGADADGTAWVFTRSGSTWAPQGPPLIVKEEAVSPEHCANEVAECGVGRGVALSADGNTALIGGPADHANRGAAWVFTRSGSQWTQRKELTGGEEEIGDGRFGRSVALSADGRTALIGASRSHMTRGAAWVFTGAGSDWAQQGPVLSAGEEIGEGRFGYSVALSALGNTALIGGRGDDGGVGAAWVFTRAGSTWEQQGAKLTGVGENGKGLFGNSVALSAFGNIALIGAPTDASGAGAAFLFARSGSTWEQQGSKLTGAGESEEAHFGYGVALSADGEAALIGAPRGGQVGAALLFARAGSTWEQQGASSTSPEPGLGERFGAGVALSADGHTALVGAPAHRSTTGAAWAFQNTSVPLPTVASVSPTEGSDAGGTRVTITGSGFTPGTTVDIGATASSVEVLSETELTAVTPAHASGPAEVLVTSGQDTSTGGPTYTYVPPPPPPSPSVASVSPSSGSSDGGTQVTLEGTGFTPDATVEIGTAAVSVHVLSETELTAVTPAHAPGPEEVVVSDADGESSGGPTYTYTSVPPTPKQPLVLTGNPLAGSGVLGTQTSMPPAPQVPPPQLGVTGNLTPVSGTVRVKLPGSKAFVVLTGTRQVPFGTIIDARQGKVTVVTVGPHGEHQVMTFYAGEFELTQGPGGRVVATLRGGSFAVCPTARERRPLAHTSSTHASGKHPVRKLWAEGHGKYSTKGNYAAGAVAGTRWLTVDRCNGTFIFVATDVVVVTNLVTHRHLRVRAGHSYLAKAP